MSTIQITCHRCGQPAEWIDHEFDARTEAVLQAAVRLTDKYATVPDLDSLRDAVHALLAPHDTRANPQGSDAP